MTPAELKTVRESLGLTAQWLADQARVKLRTVQYWESGRSRVPTDVENLVERLEDQAQDMLEAEMDAVQRLSDEKGGWPGEVALVRYRSDADLWQAHPDLEPLPVTYHAGIMARVRMELAVRSVPTVIQYADPSQ